MPLQAADFPALASKDCVAVVQFYLEAIGGGEWDKAALVWDDPVVDGARLEAVFGGYKVPQVEWAEPFVEGAAGSSFCTVGGKLTDAGDPARPMREGSLLLRRVNELVGSGVRVISLLALSDSGAPAYDHELAAALTALGVPAFACTPDAFPDLLAVAIGRGDVAQWVAAQQIAAQAAP